MGILYFYHPASNDVTEYKEPVTFDQFVHEERADNSFWIGDREDDKLEIYSDNIECMCLLRDKQTPEQAVILFATMLGLREAARE